jgi:hypothetical protein
MGGGAATRFAMAPEDERVQLLGLGGALPNRLAATVIAESLGRLDDPREDGARPGSHLTAALYGRATAALRAWTSQVDLDVDLVVAASAEHAQLRETDTGLRAELPLSWLRDVWARETATVWGRFCIAATADRGELRLSTVGPELGVVEIVTIAVP